MEQTDPQELSHLITNGTKNKNSSYCPTQNTGSSNTENEDQAKFENKFVPLTDARIQFLIRLMDQVKLPVWNNKQRIEIFKLELLMLSFSCFKAGVICTICVGLIVIWHSIGHKLKIPVISGGCLKNSYFVDSIFATIATKIVKDSYIYEEKINIKETELVG